MSKLLKKFKRSVAIALSITTFAWTIGPVALLMPTQALAAEAKAGDLIKMNGLSSVYYLGADNKRYVFPNETTFKSWYGDFSSVKTIAQSELESYSLGSNATVRPGTKLVKITTNPKVYAVEAGGILKGIPDEATAKTLFGADWAKRVVDVPDAFFTNYTISDEQVSATAYPKGTLIKYAGSADIYVVDSATAARKIASTEAMTANRYKDADVVVAPSTIVYTTGAAITAAESALVDLSRTGVAPTTGGTVVATGTVAVSLSSATAGASTIIAGQAIANLASFNFKAGDADAKITSIKVKRTGVSADTTLANVYLYDGATRLTDNASVSSTYITWNNSTGIFTIPKNTTRTITVKSDIAASTSGQTVGVSINAATDITSDATLSGTFPVSGNLMSVASATNFATVDFNTTTYPASDGTPSGQNDFEVWRNTASVGNRAVNLYSVKFRQIGSVLADDIKNFELYVSGVKAGATIEKVDSNGYITFDLSATPLKLDTGNREIKVLADLIDGATRTLSLSLRQAADIVLVDTEYNANVRATANSATFSARSSVTQTIAGGTLTVTKMTTSASGDVVDGASNASLGKFEFKAAGESIKIETLRISADCTETDTGVIGQLRNGKIFANGSQVGSTADIYDNTTGTTYTDYTLGSSLVVVPGAPVTVEITADIYDNDGTDHLTANDIIQAQIVYSATLNNAQKMDSLTYFNVPTSATVLGNALTVKTGSLSLASATSYANHTVVAPKTAYKLGEWNLTAATTEAVNLTSLEVLFTASSMVVTTQVSDAYLMYGSDTTSVKSSITSATASSTWTLSKNITAGTTMNIALYGTVASASTGTIIPKLEVNGTTVGSSATVNSPVVTAQTTTWAAGSIATAATETPLDQIVYGGQTVTAGTYEINPTNDTYTLEEVCIKVASGAQAVIDRVYLYDGDTLLNTGGTPMNTYFATTTGLTLSMPANTTKTLTVKLGLNSVGTSAAAPGLNASTTLDTIVIRNSNGTKSYVSDDRQGNAVYVYKTYPVVTFQDVASRKLINNSSQDIYKFKIAPSAGGAIAVKQMKFTLSWSDLGTIGGTLQLSNLKFYRGSTDITTNVGITDAAGADAKTNGTALNESDTTGGLVIGFLNSEELISSEQIYSIKATPVNFDSGTTSSDTVAITMIGDTTVHSATRKYAVATDSSPDYTLWKLATAAVGTGATAYNFIWSDRSSTPHVAASGTSSADWANGYLVNYLDLDATVMDVKP